MAVDPGREGLQEGSALGRSDTGADLLLLARPLVIEQTLRIARRRLLVDGAATALWRCGGLKVLAHNNVDLVSHGCMPVSDADTEEWAI